MSKILAARMVHCKVVRQTVFCWVRLVGAEFWGEAASEHPQSSIKSVKQPKMAQRVQFPKICWIDPTRLEDIKFTWTYITKYSSTRPWRKFQKQEIHRRVWFLRIMDGRESPLMDRKVFGAMFFLTVAMVAMVPVITSRTIAGCSVV